MRPEGGDSRWELQAALELLRKSVDDLTGSVAIVRQRQHDLSSDIAAVHTEVKLIRQTTTEINGHVRDHEQRLRELDRQGDARHEQTIRALDAHTVGLEQVTKAGDDRERRVRGLERWRYGIPVATLMAVGAIVASVIQAVAK